MHSMSIWKVTIMLVWVVIVMAPLWRIAAKAGYSGALSLLMLVPFVNLVLLWAFAVMEWPVEKRADRAQPPA